jgi:general L-amino acid transport system permease protein
MSESTVEGPELVRPPRVSVGAIGWLRAHLFSSWFNTILTGLAVWLILATVPGVISWAFLDSVWGDASPEACKEAAGACWAFVYEKYRFILFGFYPWGEHDRPLIAMIIFLALILTSCFRRAWGRPLIAAWVIGLTAVAILMWGGVLGLTYVDQSQWGGLPLTLFLATFGIAGAFPLAILLALGRRSEMPAIKSLCIGYIELVRGVPLISVLFMASVMFPLFLPTGVSIDKLLRAQVGIILFSAAYLAEVIRGGLQAIPKGQYEAADALGLTYWQSMRKIILPQALRITIPPMVNTFIGGFKDTSLVLIIGLFDLLMTTRTAFQDIEWRQYFVEGYVFCALIYFTFCFFMSRYSQWLERDLTRSQSH